MRISIGYLKRIIQESLEEARYRISPPKNLVDVLPPVVKDSADTNTAARDAIDHWSKEYPAIFRKRGAIDPFTLDVEETSEAFQQNDPKNNPNWIEDEIKRIKFHNKRLWISKAKEVKNANGNSNDIESIAESVIDDADSYTQCALDPDYMTNGDDDMMQHIYELRDAIIDELEKDAVKL